MEKELTKRQKQVARLFAEGYANKEVAAKLHISHRTVEFHRAQIAERIGAKGTAAVTRYAIRHGLIKA